MADLRNRRFASKHAQDHRVLGRAAWSVRRSSTCATCCSEARWRLVRRAAPADCPGGWISLAAGSRAGRSSTRSRRLSQIRHVSHLRVSVVVERRRARTQAPNSAERHWTKKHAPSRTRRRHVPNPSRTYRPYASSGLHPEQNVQPVHAERTDGRPSQGLHEVDDDDHQTGRAHPAECKASTEPCTYRGTGCANAPSTTSRRALPIGSARGRRLQHTGRHREPLPGPRPVHAGQKELAAKNAGREPAGETQ